MNYLFLSAALALSLTTYAQSPAKHKTPADTLRTQTLDPVSVAGRRMPVTESLPDVKGTYLLAGKRSEIISITGQDANIAQKSARQLLARVPGLFVYDMDGSGNQLNIATRGLDPHRSWEYNIRQNGVITNSDMYGYPASHYSPPMESVEEIEDEDKSHVDMKRSSAISALAEAPR